MCIVRAGATSAEFLHGGDTFDLNGSAMSTEIAGLKEKFLAFDKDGDGTINTKELGPFLGSIGLHPTRRELDEMVRHADMDGDSTIDFPEFVSLMRARKQRLMAVARAKAGRQHALPVLKNSGAPKHGASAGARGSEAATKEEMGNKKVMNRRQSWGTLRMSQIVSEARQASPTDLEAKLLSGKSEAAQDDGLTFAVDTHSINVVDPVGGSPACVVVLTFPFTVNLADNWSSKDKSRRAISKNKNRKHRLKPRRGEDDSSAETQESVTLSVLSSSFAAPMSGSVEWLTKHRLLKCQRLRARDVYSLEVWPPLLQKHFLRNLGSRRVQAAYSDAEVALHVWPKVLRRFRHHAGEGR